jgi:hypothetical protein
MIAGVIEGHTNRLGAPQGVDPDECHALHVRVAQWGDTGRIVIQSAWFPTPDELKRLQEGAPVILSIVDNAHPMVALGVGENKL